MFMKRYTLSFSENFEKILSMVSEIDGITKAAAIRNSVAIYGYIVRELVKGGRKLVILDQDETIIKEIVLPATMFTSQNETALDKSKGGSRTTLTRKTPIQTETPMMV